MAQSSPWEGGLQHRTMRRVRISRGQPESLLRQQGHEDFAGVRAGYLGPSGKGSFNLKPDAG